MPRQSILKTHIDEAERCLNLAERLVGMTDFLEEELLYKCVLGIEMYIKKCRQQIMMAKLYK